MTNPSATGGSAQPIGHWGREGFHGESTYFIPSHYTPDFLAVEGAHAPHRLRLRDLVLPDRDDPEALPLPILTTRSGLSLAASGRQGPMPFVVSNVEADEIHFMQEGQLEFITDHGTLAAAPGEFVCIPRAVAYAVRPLQAPTLSLVVEVPGAVGLEHPELFGPDVERATIDTARPSGGETVVLVKAFDGVTRYVKPHDPLAAVTLVDGTIPVWKLSLASLARRCADTTGQPTAFAAWPHLGEKLYNLSARRRDRPPIHHNADYDEIVYYFAGPGAWGAVGDPGTLTWVPKGLVHHGPPQDVPGGYLAWLLESRATMRLTAAGRAAAELMELGLYDRHPAAARAAETARSS
jgi:homogentisate 1,2-dioxygenase